MRTNDYIKAYDYKIGRERKEYCHRCKENISYLSKATTNNKNYCLKCYEIKKMTKGRKNERNKI